MSKHHYKTLMLLPLLAICLSGCYEIIPEDTPEVSEDEFTPEGSYSVPEEDTSESSSIPYESTSGTDESTGGDSSSTPSETPGGNTSSPSETPGGGGSSDSTKPSEPDDPSDPSESSGSSSSTPSETHNYRYTLEITNKEALEDGIVNSFDTPNTYNYSLEVALNIYDEDIYIDSKTLTSEDVSTSSSNPSIIDIAGLDLVLGTQSGEVTLSVFWNEDNTITDSVTLYYSYTEHQLDLNYTYDLEITNKEELGSTWLTSDSPKTVELKLTKYTYDGTTLIDTDDSISPAGNVELSAQNIVSDYESVVTISGFDVSGAHPGSLTLTATWIETSATDSVELIIEEDYIDGNYSISVNSDDITSSDWHYGDAGRAITGSLSYTTSAYSDPEKVETHTIDISSDNVNIEIKDSDGNPSSVLTNDGLTLIPIGYGTATVYISWISEQEILATTSFEVTILEPIAPVYKLEITNVTDLQQTWYLGDSPRELKISITPDSTTAEEQDVTSLINNNEIQVNVSPSDALDVSISGGSIYLSPLKAYESITVSVSWLGHEEAFSSVTLALGEHSYAINITNSDDLSSAWSIEEGARELKYNLYQDGSLLDVETGYIELKSNNEELAIVEGFNITPKDVGEPIIYILWYEDDEKTNLLAYDLVTLSINSNIAATGLTLSVETIVFANITEEYSVSATVYGLNNELATNQEVTWSCPNGFVLVETEDDNTVTISATQYNVSGNLVCTSIDGGYTSECSLSIGDMPTPPTPNIGQDQTYKLGADAGSNDYHFFNGELTSGTSYLMVTNNWNKAADIYITAIPYDGLDNSCTLSFVDDSGSLKYLNNDNSNNTVTLSTSPVTWVYNETNSVFAVSSSDGHALFLYSGESIRCYQQNTNNLNNPHITAYTSQPEGYEDPADYTVVEPQEGDQTYALGCLDSSNTYHYFNGSTTGSTFLATTTEWDSAAPVYITPVEGLEEAYTLAIASGGSYKYITATGSTSVTIETVSAGKEPCLWYWNSTNGVYAINSPDGRALFYLESTPSFRSYDQTTTYLNYPHVVAYSENPNTTAPTSITITGKDSLYVGGTTQLSIEVDPNGANNSVVWSSSEPSVATVNQTGYVEALAVGKTTITATSTLNESVYGSITIEVTETPSGLTEKLLGTIDMTQNTKNSSNISDTTLNNLLSCWTGDSSAFTSVSSVSYVYLGANSNSNEGNEKVLQVGSSSNTGAITLGFSENVTKVVVYGAGYVDSSARGLTVGSQSQSFSSYITAANIGNDSSWSSYAQTLEFELDGSSQSVTIANTGKRVVLRTIDIYYLG